MLLCDRATNVGRSVSMLVAFSRCGVASARSAAGIAHGVVLFSSRWRQLGRRHRSQVRCLSGSSSSWCAVRHVVEKGYSGDVGTQFVLGEGAATKRYIARVSHSEAMAERMYTGAAQARVDRVGVVGTGLIRGVGAQGTFSNGGERVAFRCRRHLSGHDDHGYHFEDVADAGRLRWMICAQMRRSLVWTHLRLGHWLCSGHCPLSCPRCGGGR